MDGVNVVLWVSTWQGPRWAGAESMIRDLAWRLGLDCQVQVEKGWISERGRLRVRGDGAKVRQFQEAIAIAVREYNA